MVPAIRIGREALGEPFPAALATIKRRQALREMVRLDEEMGLYDDSPAIACQ